MLILASRSPRRQALLRAADIDFRVVVPDISDEIPERPGARYSHIVRRAALAKALDVAQRADGIILAADTIVVCDREIIEKPRDQNDAKSSLKKLSGCWHSVYTGVALVLDDRRLLGHERTEVAFRRLSNKEIEAYIATGESMDKAGSYAIQGDGAAFVRAIRGCYTNVIGLPLPKVLSMLAEFCPGDFRA